MLQFLLDQFARLIIQHGNTLLSCVQIHAYNFHLGLLRSEQSVVRAPPSYSARCEADFVMPSDGTLPDIFNSMCRCDSLRLGERPACPRFSDRCILPRAVRGKTATANRSTAG